MTIKKASEKLKKGEITSVELTKVCLEKIKKENPKINAFITVTEDLALKQAEESDKRAKKLSLLDGIPIAVKDNMCTEGVRTTAGSKILDNFIPPFDATVVRKLKEAGAVIVGKTNMDEFAMGSSTENSAYGPTKNPADPSKVPGGSSGGSAAAVAADMCLGALGSDTGGSIRQPAYFCGVYGFKPTYGAVSRYGLIAMASSLDQIGPIAKTAEDCKIIFDVIKGQDELDATSIKINKKQTANNNLKIGKIDRDIKIAEIGKSLAVYYIIMPVEVASNLARFDGIKYGYSATSDKGQATSNLMEIYTKTRAKGFGDEAKRRIMLGTYAASAGYFDQYYLKAAKVRTIIKNGFDEAFKKYDLLEMPVSPTPAFKLGEKISDPLTMYLSDIYTVPVNLAGLPALATPDNRQIIGRFGKDDEVLNYVSK